MKVSVLMVTYNQERFIRQAIDSVLMQRTDFEYELVIGEDCSTDGTREICEQYARDNRPKIRLLRRETNMGSRQNAIDTYFACRGQYLAVLEGDDYWTCRDKLQKQVDALDGHPEWTVCFHRVRCFYEDGSGEPYDFPESDHKRVSTLEDLFGGNFIQTCSLMVRNGLIQEFPDWYLRNQPCDWVFNIFHARHGKILYLPEVMAAYRRHPGGCWSGKGHLESAGEAIAMLEDLMAELAPQHRRWARAKIANLFLERANLLVDRGQRRDAIFSVMQSVRNHPLDRMAFSARRCGMMVRAVTPGLHGLVRRICGSATRQRDRIACSSAEDGKREKETTIGASPEPEKREEQGVRSR